MKNNKIANVLEKTISLTNDCLEKGYNVKTVEIVSVSPNLTKVILGLTVFQHDQELQSNDIQQGSFTNASLSTDTKE